MSLILDALKKLESERESPEQVVVVGSIPWQGVRRSRRAPLLAAAAALVVVGGVASWLALARPTATRQGAGATTPSPARSPAAAPTASPADGAPSAAAVPSPEVASRTVATRPPAAPARPLVKAEVPGGGRRAVPIAPAASESPAERPAGDRVDLQLMAISSQQGQPVAVISGRVVREGDRFDGVRVVRIGEAEVELEVRGRRRVLRF